METGELEPTRKVILIEDRYVMTTNYIRVLSAAGEWFTVTSRGVVYPQGLGRDTLIILEDTGKEIDWHGVLTPGSGEVVWKLIN